VGAYNGGAGGNIQTLVLIAETPVFGALLLADAREKLSEAAARRIVSVKAESALHPAGTSEDEETL
jgi:hypothetical protein